MKVRRGTTVGLVLCLGVALARPQIGRLGASQEPAAGASQEPAAGVNQEATASTNQEAGVTEEMSTAAQATAAAGCNAELWNHVYRKTRLHIVHSCIAVTGTVKHVKREADGDDHIQLAVDPEFSKLLNARNKSAQADTLILETVCQGPAFQADAHAACHGFHSPVGIPKAGSKVRVVGSYVLDKAQGWMEIHPVSSIEVLR